jgi:hypothetical protein
VTENHLRQLLLDIDTAPATPDPVARVRRKMRRRASTIIVLAGMAILSVGAGTVIAAGHVASTHGGLVSNSPRRPAVTLPDVPFAARPYPPLAANRTPTERYCEGNDLSLTGSTSPRDANAIGVALTVRLANTSSTACQVPLRGSVEVAARGGNAIGQGGIGNNTDAAGDVQPAVPPAGTAVLTGYWAQPCRSDVDATSMQVTLTPPGSQPGDEVSVSGPVTAAAPAPTCQPPLKVMYTEGTASLYRLVVLDAQHRRVDKPSLSLTAELVDVPSTVRMGQELRFGVRLHNPTDGPIALTDRNCPLFATLLNRPGRSSGPAVDGAMNCQAAPPALPAGADITFRFQFSVASVGHRPGTWTLYWTRTDGGDAQLQAPVQLLPASDARSATPPS